MTFAPIIPWPLLVLAIVAVLALTVLAFTPWGRVRRGRSQPQRSMRPAAFRCAAVVLLLLAAMRPGWAGGQAQTAASDMDVFFVVDTSTSMAAEDYNGTQTRLAGATQDVMAIAKELAGAKFALITFDNKANLRMPLTRDATALQTAMTTLQPQNARYATGSSVTGASQLLKEKLATATEQHPGRPALVFYAGDGENTSAERPSAMDAANVAGGAVLGYGTIQGGRMKETSDTDAGYLKDRSSDSARDAVSRIDEGQLRTIADQLHVPYTLRNGTGATSDMLGKAQPGALTITDGDTPGRIELYWLLAMVAFLLALHEPLRHLAALINLRTPARKEPSP
ncbi:VWA domain-containing protein [Paenarthrobacter sp. A20]|uniref:vWA domain-containing protein n=1 Tax=Paenarthrobacter sp. A20 TaxID=2817891 RepID=UPI00209D756A|nr:VWA domain-containing protein [Paenarthrobacter sp. A20]MCP1414303.1 Ca-activated chloride channel family protein [Paenarthrobacter sp. A20]